MIAYNFLLMSERLTWSETAFYQRFPVKTIKISRSIQLTKCSIISYIIQNGENLFNSCQKNDSLYMNDYIHSSFMALKHHFHISHIFCGCLIFYHYKRYLCVVLEHNSHDLMYNSSISKMWWLYPHSFWKNIFWSEKPLN